MPQKPKPLDDTKSVRDWWGLELRNWRRVHGLSSRALGAKVHLSSTAIERIEKNERSCNATLADQLDGVLDAGGALRRLWARVEMDADRQCIGSNSSGSALPTKSSGRHTAGMPREVAPAFSDRSVSPVERRAFLTAGGMAAFGPRSFTDLIPKAGHAPLPKVVRPGTSSRSVWLRGRWPAGTTCTEVVVVFAKRPSASSDGPWDCWG